MHKQFLKLHQRRIANIAIGPSTARRMGPKGTIRAAREFLAKISLKDIAAKKNQFPGALDTITQRLRKALPRGGRHWGAARKFLNIFLRDATYNNYLREEYELGRIEHLLELPIDSQVAKRLQVEREGRRLTRWESVISLSPAQNGSYQSVANKVALRRGVRRVDLDLIYWRAQTGRKRKT